MKTTQSKATNKLGRLSNYNLPQPVIVDEIIESADQIKSWNREKIDFSYVYVFLVGMFLGLVVTMILATPHIINSI